MKSCNLEIDIMYKIYHIYNINNVKLHMQIVVKIK